MSLRLFGICLLYGLLWPAATEAQRVICVDSSEVYSYDISNYRVEDGLSQNTVKHIRFDNAGFLWMVTEKGISRFDGSGFRNYLGPEIRTHGSRPGFLYFTGDTLLVDKKPHLFIADGQLNYDSSTYFLGDRIVINRGQPVRMKEYSDFPFGYDSLLYLTQHGIPLYYISDSSFYFNLEHPFLAAVDLGYFEKGENLGSTGEMHWESTFVFQDQLGHIKDGILRFYKGVSAVDSLDVSFLGPDIDAIWQYPGPVFIHSLQSNDIYELVTKGHGLCLKRIINNWEFGKPNCITEDHSGGYWIGSRLKGLYHYKRHFFESWIPLGYEAASFKDITAVGKDSVLAAKGFLLTPDKSYRISRNDGPLIRKLMDGAADPSVFQGDTLAYPGKRSESHSDLLRMPPWTFHYIEDQRGDMWLNVFFELHREQNGQFPKVNIEDWDTTLEHSCEAIFYNENKGEIWVNANDVTSIFHPEESRFEELKGVPKGRIQCIYFGEDGINYLRYTDRGFYLNRDTITIPMPKDPLNYLQFAHCIVRDSLGYFWISSDHGLFRVLEQDLIEHFNDPDRSVYYHFFDNSNGFANNEFNGEGRPCGTVLPDGKIAFPSFEGVAVFDPLKVPLPLHGKDIIIDQIRIDQKDSSISEGIVLDQDFKDLSFYISHALYDHPNNQYVQYKLKGFHQNWIPLPKDGVISFSTLGYGKYELQVRKLVDSGAEGIQELYFPFSVSKRYYETSWFILALVLFIAGVIFLSARARNRLFQKRQEHLETVIEEKTFEYRELNEELNLNVSRLRTSENELLKNNKLKDRMMAIYVHDVRGPLQFIKLLAEESLESFGKKNKEVAYYFEAIQNASAKLFRQTEHMFKWSLLQQKDVELRFQEVSLRSYVSEILQHFEEQMIEKKIAISNNINPDQLLETEPNMLQIIINNLLQNAIKFTSNGKISLHAGKIKNYTILKIMDTGIGMDKEKVDALNSGETFSTPGTKNEKGSGFGIRVVRDFMTKLDGQIEVESDVGVGTTISLFFRNNH